MNQKTRYVPLLFLFVACMVLFVSDNLSAASPTAAESRSFPRSLESYHDGQLDSIPSILANRIRQEPFNLLAGIIFFAAIVHTFFYRQIHGYRPSMGAQA